MWLLHNTNVNYWVCFVAFFLIKKFKALKCVGVKNDKCEVRQLPSTVISLPHFNHTTKMTYSTSRAKHCQMLWSWRENILRSKLAENANSLDGTSPQTEMDHIHHDFHPNTEYDECNFYRTQVSGVRSLGQGLCPSLSTLPCWDLTDVTLADEDTDSILTENANRTAQ